MARASWVAVFVLGVIVGVAASRVVPADLTAFPAGTTAPPASVPTFCIDQLESSNASVTVSGDNAGDGCRWLESLTVDPKRWYRATEYVDGPVLCTFNGARLMYTVRDQGAFNIDGGAWCRWIQTWIADRSVSLP